MSKECFQSKAHLEILKSFSLKPNGFILISGSNGTGKTYSAKCIYDNCTIYDTDLKIQINSSDLYRKWKHNIKEWGDDDFLFKQINKTELLIIDDIGVRTPTDAFIDFLHALIDSRYEKREKVGTVITTNLNSGEIIQKFGSWFLSRAASGHIFRWDGPDRRCTPTNNWKTY